MIHGCTEPSSTLQPYAFAIAAHEITDPMGANANATITKSARKYHSHGNLLYGLPFITAIPNHRLPSTFLLLCFSDLPNLLDDPCCSARSKSAAKSAGGDLSPRSK